MLPRTDLGNNEATLERNRSTGSALNMSDVLLSFSAHALRARRSPRSFVVIIPLRLPASMASISATAMSILVQPKASLMGQGANGIFCLKSVSFTNQSKSFRSLRLQPAPLGLRFSCAAKPETVEKVCEIVKKQLALPEGTDLSGESKFAALGADSLDTVEIVMGLEEAFDITVEEDSAQTISTVLDAANMIDKLVEAKTN